MQAKQHTRYGKKATLLKIGWLILLSLLITSCDEAFPDLDEDGGYYNPKTGKYQYVFPSKKGVDMDPQKIQKPRPGETQELIGVVAKVSDTRSFWLRIPERQTYMILAQGVGPANRDDKKKELRFLLKYVDPEMMNFPSKQFKTQWLGYVRQLMERELLAKPAVIKFQYEGNAHQFRAVANIKDKTGQGRNVNLWMVRQGLSYYVIQHGRSPRDKTFRQAEILARKNKTGLWQY